MNRTYDAVDLVMLPRLDASSAVALGEALLTQAKDAELAQPVADAAKKMKLALASLSEAARARLEIGPAGEEDLTEAHRSAAAAWKAMRDFLSSWAHLPEKKGGDKTLAAKRIFSVMFDGGLKFLRRPYASEWAEAEHRLKWLAEQQLEGAFDDLGGSEFLVEVRAAHKRYGEVLGIKKARAVVREPPSIRVPLDAFRGRLRQYVVQVTAQGELDVEGAKEHAARLLAPLAQWQSIRAQPRAEEVGEEPDDAQPVSSNSAESPDAIEPRSSPSAARAELDEAAGAADSRGSSVR